MLKQNKAFLGCTVLFYKNRLYFSDYEPLTQYSKEYHEYIDELGMSIPECEKVINVFTNSKDIMILEQRHLDEGKSIWLWVTQGNTINVVKVESRFTYPD